MRAFPDFDVHRFPTNREYARATGLKYSYKIRSNECTVQARDAIEAEVAKARPDSVGQSLWLDVRKIVLAMIQRGEIVRVGLTWDVP